MSIPKTTTFAALAVASLLLAAVPMGAADPVDAVSGIVISESHDALGQASTFQIQPTLGSNDPSGVAFGGRGATFQFGAEKAIMNAFNAKTGALGGYWGCGSGCGKDGLTKVGGSLGGTTPASGCPSDTTRFGGDGASCGAIGADMVLFAGSDSPANAATYALATGMGSSGLLTMPLAVGLITVAYNNPACSSLQLTPTQIAQIFSGATATWGDVSGNSCTSGDTTPITFYWRCDKSGTTFGWTDFLTTSGSGYAGAKTEGPVTASHCGTGNSGMGAAVAATPGAIAYVELDKVLSLGLQTAQVQNKAGLFTAPTIAGGQAAMDNKAPTLPKSEESWSSVSLVWADGATSYPIVSFTYVMTLGNPAGIANYASRFTADQYNAVRSYLQYAVSDEGQAHLTAGYVPLSAAAQSISIRGAGLMHWDSGAVATETVGNVFLAGYPAVGARGTYDDGKFAPDASNYHGFAGNVAGAAQNHEGQYVSYAGQIIVAGALVVTDSGLAAVVDPTAGFPSGIYAGLSGQIVNGVLVVQSLAA